MTIDELATFIASWTTRNGLQGQLDAIISASGATERQIDEAFNRAARLLA